MPAVSASAPGKIILLGEHAVVYGRPALALPLFQVQARVAVQAQPLAPAGQVILSAPDISVQADLSTLPQDDSLAKTIRLAEAELGGRLSACRIKVSSTIPIASGLGSGAAVSVALLRAVSAFAGTPFPDETINRLAFEVEKLHHGTPSGIDNTVITFGKPVYFKKGQPPIAEKPGAAFTFLAAGTGVPSPTAVTVGDVRQGWQRDPEYFNALFDQVGRLVDQARSALESGQAGVLGPLMDQNQAALESMGVSSPELERLVSAARQAGALGAKLSGGGRGGNIIALVEDAQAASISAALEAAGAVQVLSTRIF